MLDLSNLSGVNQTCLKVDKVILILLFIYET